MRLAARTLAIVAFGTVLVAVGSAQGAPVEMTLDELVTRALDQHLELLATRLEIEAATARVRQAGLRPNPMLDLGGQKAISPDNNLTIGVTVPLDLNGRKEGRVLVAEREAELRRAQLDDRARRIRAEIRMKAGEVLAIRRNLQTTADLLDANQRAFGIIRDRVREGAAPALDESLQLVEVNRLQTNVTLLQSRVDVATLQLGTAAGVPSDPPIALRGDFGPTSSAGDREEALRWAASERPDLRAAQAEAAMAAAKVRKEQAEGRWDASVNVGYQRQVFGFDLQGLTDTGATRPIQDTFHYFGGGVSVTLPVRNRNQGNIAAAMAESRAAERRRELVALTVRQEVTGAFTQYEGARRALEQYERGVRDVARRNFELVRQAYELGRGTLLDVIAEQRRFIEVEAGYTEALKQVYDAAVDVERAIGAPGR
jgi:cobalt-zinc-cadmium efflux system outer membrane protein